jgi:hypothetical protein
MDQIASNVLNVPIKKNMIFTILFILIDLLLYYVFQAPLSIWDFFSTKLHMSIAFKNWYM